MGHEPYEDDDEYEDDEEEVSFEEDVLSRLDALLEHSEICISLLETIVRQGEELMSREQDVLDAISEETNVGTAVVLLLDKVAEDLAEIKAGMDPAAAAKLDEAIAKLKANKEVYSAAVVRHTPAEDPVFDHAAGM